MQIFVQSLLYSSKTLTIEVEPSDSVENLKTKVQDAEDVDPILIKLFFNGTEIEDGNTLASYNITKEVSITSANNISQLATKEAKQLAKLDLAASKRDDTYNVNTLPNPYNGNDSAPDDGANTLSTGRPWI